MMGLSRRTVAAVAAIAVAAARSRHGVRRRAGSRSTFAAEDGVATVPFESLGGLVVLPVTIGTSRPLRFVLDSGAGRMVLDRAVADELGSPAKAPATSWEPAPAPCASNTSGT